MKKKVLTTAIIVVMTTLAYMFYHSGVISSLMVYFDNRKDVFYKVDKYIKNHEADKALNELDKIGNNISENDKWLFYEFRLTANMMSHDYDKAYNIINTKKDFLIRNQRRMEYLKLSLSRYNNDYTNHVAFINEYFNTYFMDQMNNSDGLIDNKAFGEILLGEMYYLQLYAPNLYKKFDFDNKREWLACNIDDTPYLKAVKIVVDYAKEPSDELVKEWSNVDHDSIKYSCTARDIIEPLAPWEEK